MALMTPLCKVWFSKKWNASRKLAKPHHLYRTDKDGFIDKDLAEPVVSFTVYDYDLTKGTAYVLWRLSPEEQKLAVREIKAFDAYLQSAEFLRGDSLTVKLPGLDVDENGDPADKQFSVPATAAAKAFRDIWFENGEPVTPIFGVNSGNRRSFAMPWINAVRSLIGKDAILEIPATVKHYTTENERMIDCALLNAVHKVGMRDMSEIDEVYFAHALLLKGGRERDLRKLPTWTVAKSQTRFVTAEVHDYFEHLDLLNTLSKGSITITDPETGKETEIKARITTTHKEDIRKVRQLVETDANGIQLKTRKARRARSKEQDCKDKATEMMLAIFTGQGSKRAKSATRKDIEDQSDLNKVDLITVVLEAVLENKLPTLASYNAFATELNRAFAAVMAGKDLAEAIYLTDANGNPAGEPVTPAQTKELAEQVREQARRLAEVETLLAGKSKSVPKDKLKAAIA